MAPGGCCSRLPLAWFFVMDSAHTGSRVSYDGKWTVSSTFTGLLKGCPAGTYVSTITVKRGNIRHKRFTAKIAPDGTITGTVSLGASRALIAGKMAGSTGSGKISVCKGRFTVSR